MATARKLATSLPQGMEPCRSRSGHATAGEEQTEGHRTARRWKRYTDPATISLMYLKQYVNGARKKNAIPILLTLTPRHQYVDGVFENAFLGQLGRMKWLGSLPSESRRARSRSRNFEAKLTP
jgi:hypothetical protein